MEEIAGEIDGYETGAAAHAGEIVAADVSTELIPVDDHGGEGRGWGKEAAIDDEDVDVVGFEACAGEQVVDGGEDDEAGLGAGGFHVRVWGNVMVRRREAGFLSEARSLEDAGLELIALFVGADQAGVLHEGGEGDAACQWGFEAGVIEEIYRARSGHEVDGAGEDEDEGGAEDLEEIELQ